MNSLSLSLNRLLRFFLSISFCSMQILARIYLLLVILFYKFNQRRLSRKLDVLSFTPAGYSEPEIELQSGEFWVETSGSSNVPKKMRYSLKRVGKIKLYFMLSILASLPVRLKLKTFFVLSSLDSENSLTDVMTKESKKLNHFQMLQAPYRLLHAPEFKDHVKNYHHQALRLWLYIVTRPRILYATNPSSIVLFNEEIKKDHALSFIQDYVNGKLSNQKEIEKIYHSIKDTNVNFQSILDLQSRNLVSTNPMLESIISWDGGYVTHSLDQLKTLFPKLKHFPLFSMSTENIETVSFASKFLPLAPETCYEFLKDGKLIRPWNLQLGSEYEMIISNKYGLTRYLTGDIFECRSKFFGLPDLIFKKRTGLTFSFTGEKITAEQLHIVSNQLLKKHPQLSFCVIPQLKVPSYVLYIITENLNIDGPSIGNEYDELLKDVNVEYAQKRNSGRLDTFEVKVVSLVDFVEYIKGEKFEKWESQFKILPLYPYQRDPKE